MKSIYLNTLLLALISMPISSCVKDSNNIDNSTLQDKSIRLNLRVPSTSPNTYSVVGSDSENDINNVHVLFFFDDPEDATSENVLYAVSKGKDIKNPTGTSKSFDVDLPIDPTYVDKLFLCHIISNAGSTIANNFALTNKGKTQSEIQNLLNKTITSSNIATGGIVMWGESSITPSSTILKMDVTLIRSIARVDIGIGSYNSVTSSWDKGSIPFTLTNAYIFKPQNAVSYMPKIGSFDSATDLVTSHSAIGSQHTTPFSYTTTASDHFIKGKIYIPEANVRLSETGASGDSNHSKRCAVVVGGKYSTDTEDSFYRIDFNNNETPRKMIDILRNHLYRVNITSVLGRGYPTKESAYEAEVSNIEVVIEDWNDINQDIIFDGVNFVHVERRWAILPGILNVSSSIKLKSSINFDEWKMGFKPASGNPVFITDATISNDDFTFTRSPKATANADGSYSGEFTISAKKILNKGEADRKATVVVQVDKLIFEISITQKPISQEDWELGGDFDIVM